MSEDFGSTTRILKLDLPVAPRVLLVEDDDLVLEHLRGLIAAAGFEVCTAANGLEALEFLKHTFAPVIITDQNMPGMDGATLCRAIRAQSWPGYIYVLLLTAQDREADILMGLDAGADDYLSKRVSPAQLLARLWTAQRILTLEHSLKEALAQKQLQAMTDPLTGAPNRRYFTRRFTRLLKRVHRYGGEFSLLALDIDNFKHVNDRHGHAVGDDVLQQFLARIRTCLRREGDWCARVGGEEFAVVLEGTPLSGAGVVAENLRQVVAGAPMKTAAGSMTVTVSIGVSGVETIADRRNATVEMLLAEADQGLYASKKNGRNCVTLPQRYTLGSEHHGRVA
jgi:diguanylate cyclase (GGDEF)-like protein